MPGRRIFITGASGKLGARVTSLLLDRGDHVTGLARSAASAAKIEKLGATAVKGTTTDSELLTSEAAKADVVLHFAFNHDIAFTDYKRACTEDQIAIKALIEGLKDNHGGQNEKVFIYSSGTLGADGPDEDSKKPVDDQLPRYVSENLTYDAASPTLRSIVMRLAPIVHERESIHWFLQLMIDAAKKSGFSGYVDANNVWPAAHHDDVAELVVLAIDKAPSGKTLNAVAEEGVNTKDLAQWIGDELGVPVKAVPQDKAMDHFGFVGFLLSFKDAYTTNVKTKQWTGWDPKKMTLLAELRQRGLKDVQ